MRAFFLYVHNTESERITILSTFNNPSSVSATGCAHKLGLGSSSDGGFTSSTIMNLKENKKMNKV